MLPQHTERMMESESKRERDLQLCLKISEISNTLLTLLPFHGKGQQNSNI